MQSKNTRLQKVVKVILLWYVSNVLWNLYQLGHSNLTKLTNFTDVLAVLYLPGPLSNHTTPAWVYVLFVLAFAVLWIWTSDSLSHILDKAKRRANSLPKITFGTPFWWAMTIEDVFFKSPFIGTGLLIILCYGLIFYGGYTQFFNFSSNIWVIGIASLFASIPFLGVLFYVLELASEELKADFPRLLLLSIRIAGGVITMLIMVWFLYLPLNRLFGGELLGTIAANWCLLVLYCFIMVILSMIIGDA